MVQSVAEKKRLKSLRTRRGRLADTIEEYGLKGDAALPRRKGTGVIISTYQQVVAKHAQIKTEIAEVLDSIRKREERELFERWPSGRGRGREEDEGAASDQEDDGPPPLLLPGPPGPPRQQAV
eukprot:TRINITY_DN28194_c0_g1_i1.p1 TRINITY_DN28194_c0_g1~~TRINITY_DN28194_c0_g1_i1.p1  ORF type:complete len:123 (-),score=0.01 TRINITY_DN28194_c0_g1_i1:191-559(-)